MNCIYCGHSVPLIDSFCDNCGSAVCGRPPIVYTANYHAYKLNFFRPKVWYLLRKGLTCGLLKSKVVADIGCGAGHALYWANLLGKTTIGWDVMGAPMNYAITDFTYDDLTKMTRSWWQQVDTVWCWHTLEHTEQPNIMLKAAVDILKPNTGTLYLEFPEAELTRKQYKEQWLSQAHFPEHRGLPSAKWVRETIAKLGGTGIREEIPTEGQWMYGKFWGKPPHLRMVIKKFKQ